MSVQFSCHIPTSDVRGIFEENGDRAEYMVFLITSAYIDRAERVQRSGNMTALSHIYSSTVSEWYHRTMAENGLW